MRWFKLRNPKVSKNDSEIFCITPELISKYENVQVEELEIGSEDIKEIRNSNLSSYKLADIYGISQSQINRIKLNKRWKHI